MWSVFISHRCYANKTVTMALLYIPVLLLVITYLLYKYFTRTFNYWKERNVNGPKPMAFYGNMFESAIRRKTHGAVFKEIYVQFPNEKVVGIYRMTTPSLLLRDLDVIKNVMIKDFNTFVDRGVEFSKKGLGVNLAHSDGSTWKALRYHLTPIFTSVKIKNMFELMVDAADKFINEVEQLRMTQLEHEVHSLTQRYTLATISSCAFGLTIDSLKDKMDALDFIDKNVVTNNFFLELDMMYPGILKRLNLSLYPAKVSKFFNYLVETAISQRNGMPSGRKDLMDSLIELKNKGTVHAKNGEEMKELSIEITNSVIAAQAFIFYLAGYDTSASTLAYMFYELAKGPEMQDRMIAEIDEALKNSGGKITYESINNMPYTGQIFDETLRMYPALDNLQRNAKHDYKIQDTNVTIRKGQTVMISVLGIHYDEKHYPNPTKFDPERFNPENNRERHIGAYLPFGIGPRHCIGMRFAKVQSMVVIAAIFSKYRLEPSKNTPNKIVFNPTKILNHPQGGIHVNIVPRLFAI